MASQLHVRLPDELEADVRAYAEEYGITITAAIRVLLRQALKKEQ